MRVVTLRRWIYTSSLVFLLLQQAVLLGQQLPDADEKDSDQFRRGIEAYKAYHYANAVDELKLALETEPANEKIHFYLAFSYANLVFPNNDLPENLKMAANAIAEFDLLLKAHHRGLAFIEEEASLYRDTFQWDKARDLEKQASAIDPKDPEYPFLIGLTDWRQAYSNAAKILYAETLVDDGQGNIRLSRASCESLRTANTALIADALTYLNKSLRLKPGYPDAMAYMNLVYRRRADIHCGDPAAVKADLARADQWFNKAVAHKFPVAAGQQAKSWNPDAPSAIIGGVSASPQ